MGIASAKGTLIAIKNAAETAGAAIEAGVLVIAKGSLKNKVAMRSAFGALGAAAIDGVRNRNGSAQPGAQPAAPSGDCYLAVTSTELIAMSTSISMTGKKASGILTRLPRTAISAAQLEKHALLAMLVIQLTDEQQWAFDVQRSFRKDAEAVVTALGG